MEAGEALLAILDYAACADADEIGREEFSRFFCRLGMQPLLLDADNGLGGRLRGRDKRRYSRGEQCDDADPMVQILIKIFFR
jgi:hypothetical protein